MKLDESLRRAGVWRAGELPPIAARSTGFAPLDALLPGGGWPCAGLSEILTAEHGIGALRLVLPALAELSRAGRWIVWIAPPYIPYAPALDAAGVDLARLLIVDLPAAQDPARHEVLWAFEQALRFETCAAALLWLDRVPANTLRRLQLAAESGATWGLVFRPRRCAAEASPAPLRLTLDAVVPDAAERPRLLEATVLKARGVAQGTRCRLEIEPARASGSGGADAPGGA